MLDQVLKILFEGDKGCQDEYRNEYVQINNVGCRWVCYLNVCISVLLRVPQTSLGSPLRITLETLTLTAADKSYHDHQTHNWRPEGSELTDKTYSSWIVKTLVVFLGKVVFQTSGLKLQEIFFLVECTKSSVPKNDNCCESDCCQECCQEEREKEESQYQIILCYHH